MSSIKSAGGVTRREAIRGATLAGALLALPGRAAVLPGRTDKRLTLWYDKPASVWTEALPIGNGRIGAMLFGGVESERLQLNEDTLWAGSPHNPVNPQARANIPKVRELIIAGRYAEAQALANETVMGIPPRQASYLSAGDLRLDMFGHYAFRAPGYERSLDLDAAKWRTRYTVNDVEFVREAVASPTDQVIALRIVASKPGVINCRLSLSSPLKDWSTVIDGGDTLVMNGRGDADGELPGALRFETRVRLQRKGGRTDASSSSLDVFEADELLILIAMATSYRRYDDVSGDPTSITKRQIDAVSGKSFETIAAATAQEHRRLFRRVNIDLGETRQAELTTDRRIVSSRTNPDPALAALYFQYARYLLLSCSRAGGQPANLQGLWNESAKPPWGSGYTVNINTQMNYWPAEITALPECVEPLISMVRDMAEAGARTAREMYGARGWVCHHNVDLWRSTAPIHGSISGLWPTGGAWFCTHLWQRYDYGRDLGYLRSIYPLLKGACEFFLDTLQVDAATGHLVTNPSLSPENRHHPQLSLVQGPTMDMDILRDLFDQTAASSLALGIDKEFRQQVRSARARLLPHRVGKNGQLQEWPFDWDAQAPDLHHRHLSHLYGLYPGNQIDPDETPKLARAAERSLEMRGEGTTGWAIAWQINLWARLRDSKRAHAALTELLGPERTYPNMFDAHPPFQIDGNFGGGAGISNMLMQARGDDIKLLPALPKAWPTGSISGLRAPGRCSVDLHWSNGELLFARLKAGEKGTRRVWLGNSVSDVSLKAGTPVVLRRTQFKPGGRT